jgi:hypothetical protein
VQHLQDVLQQQRDELLGQVHAAQRAAAKAEAAEVRTRRELSAQFREKSQELEHSWHLQLEAAHEATAAAQREVNRLDAEASAAARREASQAEAGKAAREEARGAAGRVLELQEQLWTLQEVVVKEKSAAAEERCRLQEELCVAAAAEVSQRGELDEMRRAGDAAADRFRCGPGSWDT